VSTTKPVGPPAARRTAADAPAAAVGARYAGLEGYRGVAALAIVVFHVYQHSRTGPAARYPYAGTLVDSLLRQFDGFVDLFFVLSAFLLALPYLRSALAGDGAPSGRAFVARRAARIVPLYLVAVTVVWAFRNPHLPGDWTDLLEHLTFTQVFDSKRIFYTIGPAWSLAVEVQFYLLLALLGQLACAVCRRLPPRGRIWVLAGGLLAVALASISWRVLAWYVLHRPEEDWPLWFGLPAKLDVFVVGMALALVVAAGGARLRGGATALLRIGSVVVVVIGFLTRPQGAGQDVWFHLIVSAGFGLLLASSVLGPADRLVRVLGGRIPALLGLVSYSVYLWHEPLLLLLAHFGAIPSPTSGLAFPVGVAVLVPVAVVVGWLSYWAIEYPASSLRVLVMRDGSPRDYHAGD